jgi:exopolyphosphatase/guanosine-5'-triphosphate,3'-diphosphate pyrophosphatase
LHIDVGGGSTELNVIHNNQMLYSKSFKLGSVRKLSTENNEAQRKNITEWIKLHKAGHEGFTAVGTGGNINKAFDLTNQDKSDRHISISDLKQVQSHVASFTLDERIHHLRLNEDRADVILPALDIYLHAMGAADCSDILVPDVGLKDGLMHMLYERNLT